MVSIEALTQKYIPSNNIEQKRKKKENIHSHRLCNIFESITQNDALFHPQKKKQPKKPNAWAGRVIFRSFCFPLSKLESLCPNFFPNFFQQEQTTKKKCRPEAGYIYTYICRIIHPRVPPSHAMTTTPMAPSKNGAGSAQFFLKEMADIYSYIFSPRLLY